MILIRSDARNLPLADESVQCCVTSPPYWGLRSYQGDPHMIGLEPRFEEHLSHLVNVFREVRRVLRKDGTCLAELWGCLCWGDLLMPQGKGQREQLIEPWESVRMTATQNTTASSVPASARQG